MASIKPKARVAVVGIGGWTQGWHLPNLANRSDVIIVAVVDPAEQPGVAGGIPSKCEPTAAVAAKYSAKRGEPKGLYFSIREGCQTHFARPSQACRRLNEEHIHCL